MTSKVNPTKSALNSTLVKMTPLIWAELQVLYETGEYTQQQLTDYAKSKGFRCHQSTVARRVENRKWIKGSLREKVRQEVLGEFREKMGEQLFDMLEQHAKVSRMMQAEVLIHFKAISERRKTDPDTPIPANQLATLTSSMKTLQDMQARSTGWDYKLASHTVETTTIVLKN